MVKKKIVSISFVAKDINIRTQLDALQNLKSALHKKNKETDKKFTVKVGNYKLSELLTVGSHATDISNRADFEHLKKLCSRFSIDYAALSVKEKQESGGTLYHILFAFDSSEKLSQFTEESIKVYERVYRKQIAEERRKQRAEKRKERK
ncbi:MAG: hypothetical protein NC092_02055 [Butyrivibrio sp.]|nr:hypothetical protein [Butyrivibrio sp.]